MFDVQIQVLGSYSASAATDMPVEAAEPAAYAVAVEFEPVDAKPVGVLL